MGVDKREDDEKGEVHCRKKGVGDVRREWGAKQDEEYPQGDGAERAC